MSNISTATRYLATASLNPQLIDLNAASGKRKAYARRDNAEFLADVAARLARWKGPAPRDEAASQPSQRASKKRQAAAAAEPAAAPEPLEIARDGVLAIGLLGQYGPLGYALRRAQEVIRVDRTPSHWSHAFLFLDPLSLDPAQNRDPVRSPRLLEATLHPGQSPSELFAFRQGVNVRRFADYADAGFEPDAPPGSPNIAVLCLGLSASERAAIRTRALHPEADLMSYDLPELLGTWFHYALGLGKRPNPLVEGVGTPSASFLQLAYDAAGIDLSPGANDRNSAPEHLWQAVRYLHPMFEALTPEGTLAPRPFIGFHCVREPHGIIAPIDAELPRSFEDFVNRT